MALSGLGLEVHWCWSAQHRKKKNAVLKCTYCNPRPDGCMQILALQYPERRKANETLEVYLMEETNIISHSHLRISLAQLPCMR
ncbi:hypothetical protein PVAP13_8KG117900 [Panicum virgatum]|uniref:Uncharacterized protein n=1 Tax=Panicum virgatum TaxID=38727 RepID=A0A8T0PE13_PANVG|nr:hypothetical protein PVAP13_8KG117900 [Panicum virgatum]